MYASKGCAKDVEILYSESVRNDIVASNILFSFYNSTGDIEGVVKRFRDMHGKVEPSAETLTLVASTFSKSGNLSQCQQLHCFALKAGFGDHVLLTSLLMTYANCGDLGAATALFSEISLVSSITWSSMISGYVEHGHYEKAIELFKQWQASRIKPGADIIRILVDVSANLGALHLGKEIHGYCVRNLSHYSFKDDFVLETSILNMYARCGSISSARHCFGLMVMRDVIAWTSMIQGLGTYGLGLEALKLFDQMLKEGIRPNSITFVSLLSACSHSGLSNKGCELFYSMKWKFGIAPELLHYTCIVDLLGRSGKLREALAIILKMLACPDGRIWGALLAGSRVHGNRNMGFYAAKKLSELEPDNVGYQIILSNVQASTEQWTKVEAIRQVLRGVHSKKAPGWSCIEVERAIEGFVSGDRSHPLMEEVYEVLGFLSRQMHDSSMCSMDKMII
ncbi:hypothetical protein Nepgr_009977 [Nepenthes gracilis]|uniref:Pentatricopeptide repeat-containing protein n=1 Tax=Nepenthes gracilis TaxID=150966 RepID=A0AAD3SBS4_NEPGR|nr:hypothetical protein Nepgr_009977 [Nepenthes gracilis]